MKNIQVTTSPGVPPRSMEEEFLSHKKGSEWWYSTGYLEDETGRMFGFQFTLAHISFYGVKIHVLLTSLTDFKNGKHYFEQGIDFLGRDIILTPTRTAFGDRAEIVYGQNQVASKGHMLLNMTGKNYALQVEMNAVKPPVWHCDHGVLKMGLVDDPKETTYYYSYTNLASTGKLIFDQQEFQLTGKSWFDKQGGTYTITNRWVHWEWFSLRFFDNEEIMLFAFPQDNYYDGTFIKETGAYARLNDYTITPLGFTTAGGYQFSNGWKLVMKGVKDEEYTIIPKIDGQYNRYFFELLAEIKDKSDTLVGYCVVELLPGVYNEKINNFKLFKREA
jgi:predicted secreted hydrolase